MPMQLDAGVSMRHLLKHGLTSVALCCSLAFAAGACAQAPPPPSEQEQQLVAPIALYPDALVAQILAASTNAVEVVEAWRWMQQHPGLQGQALADAVDPQPWDPSVKALTQFPSVLENMNANLGWTSALGDAYASGSQDVLDAVQELRQQARAAGRLPSTSQQTVSSQDQTIVIEPADPEVVYVPAYDPWLVYGAPMAAYPDWVGVPGIFYDGPDLYFGAGIGLFAGVAWGVGDWGFDWHDRRMMYHHAPYVFHGRPFAGRHGFDRGDGHVDHGGGHGDHVPAFHDVGHEGVPALHSQPEAHFQSSTHAGAYSGFDRGGAPGGYAGGGRSSFGGGIHAEGSPGGEFHGGGGITGGVAHRGGGFAEGGSRGGGARR
jgi:uncharacterized membrane protein YgcG